MNLFSTIGLVALMLALGATGCLIIPAPHTDSGYARTNVVQHTQQQFVPGQTTRTDVLLALGEPDAVSRNEHQLAYRSEKVVAWWILAAASQGGGGATGGTIYRNRFYVFEFDAQGRLQTVKQTGQWGMVQGADEPLLTPPALHSEDSPGVAAAMVRGSVQSEYPSCLWLAGADVARWKGAGYTVGQRGHLFCTESNLDFATESQFANAEPALTVPYASIAEVRVEKYFLARRLMITLKTGPVHGFLINTAGGLWQDKQAMQAVCDFIQIKVNPAQLEK